MRRGCFIIPVNKFIECNCANEIPKSLHIDVGNAKLGDVFRTNSITFPEGVKPTQNVPLDYVIGVLSSE